MKGLFVKDFKLIMMQKHFFLIMIAIAVSMIVFTGYVTFPIGFLTFVISLFALSTISYDEFDNGNAFLFTLPITRTGYALEKYCLGLLLGCITWIFSTLLSIIVTVTKGSMPITDLIMSSLMILPIMLIVQAVMFPFQIKYGGEKGRIVIIITIGLVVFLGMIIVKGSELLFHIDLLSIINNLPVVSMGILPGISFIVSIIFLLISLKISAVIMNNKEM